MDITKNPVAERLLKNGFEVYLVGGAVRDILLGEEPKDIDLSTNALPEQILNLFKDKKTFLDKKSKQVVFVDEVQVATYRSKNKKFGNTIQEDLVMRDFTINALALGIDGKIVDVTDGLLDLDQGIIRLINDSPDPILADPVRIIRACRFIAKINGEFSFETYHQLKVHAKLVKNADKERIYSEIMKALTLDKPSIFFKKLYLIGCLKYIFPDMSDCFGHSGGEHHNETVGAHLMMAGDNIHKKFPILRLAGYLHDIGKPHAFKKSKGENFHLHEYYGFKQVKECLTNLRFPTKIVDTVANLVYSHMRTCRSLTPRGVRRLRLSLAELDVNPRDYVRLKLADRKANLLRSKTKIGPIRDLIINSGIRSKEEFVLKVIDLAISGGSLIKELGLTPGPLVGTLQRNLLAQVVEEGNEINTYEILLERAKTLLEPLTKENIKRLNENS